MEIAVDFVRELEILKKKFPSEDDDMIVEEIKNAIYIYHSLRNDFEIIDFNEYEKNWIKRCAIELLSRGVDKLNIQSYSENGYSETYFSDLISNNLRYEIIPKAKGLKHDNDQEA